jgi:hypothetical protein
LARRSANITAEGPFAAGGQTSVTLSKTYSGTTNLIVYFDGTYQGPDQYSLAGKVLTFTSAVPVYVSNVYVIAVSIGNITQEGPFTGVSGQTSLTLSQGYASSAKLRHRFHRRGWRLTPGS